MPIPVNVVQALEAEFSVHLTAAEAISARSALDLYRLLLQKLGLVPGQTIGSSACVFHQLRRAIARRYGVDARRIRPNVLLRSLIPTSRWGDRLSEVAGDVGLSPFIPEVSKTARNRADWIAGGWMAAIALPLMILASFVSMDAPDRIPMGAVLIPAFLLPIVFGAVFHARLLERARMEGAGLASRTATLRTLTVACIGPLGDRLGLYDHRIDWLWGRTMQLLADELRVDVRILTAGPALSLEDHWRGGLPDREAQTVAGLAFQSSLAVQRECVAQLLAAFMRGEITSFPVWQVLFLLQGGPHQELQRLAVVLAHVVDSRNNYPITVSEEDWDYVRRMIGALRSDFSLRGFSFKGSDERHRPPEVALEPFWTASQWERCEPLLADLDLPQFDAEVHSSPAAARSMRPRVEGTPRNVYRTVMVSREAERT